MKYLIVFCPTFPTSSKRKRGLVRQVPYHDFGSLRPVADAETGRQSMVRGSPPTVSAHRRRLKLVAFERMRGDLQAAFMSNFIDWHDLRGGMRQQARN